MAKKEFTYRGKNPAQLKELSIKELAEIVPTRIRRTLLRGFTDQEKIFIKKLRSGDKKLKTHCRALPILPEMFDKTIMIYNGKMFVEILIRPEMIGHVLGEFSLTRKNVGHSSPGVGATKSSAHASSR
ncbi:30S ribosomal protein S19 [Candidatus Woesearchaeota archaeon]|jgi:small subunit ribosomal protein S19|nr:30S ribosomal protein S19 [Candidatus Woesearchaeota archaeon]MBT6520315.1 30S ribosomal protein S19 [Candidatus Woesearchaeota archaeon]MBT7368268.1 30S ribosomal protein S19 [Candidatus Woesearchaeota archaeon]